MPADGESQFATETRARVGQRADCLQGLGELVAVDLLHDGLCPGTQPGCGLQFSLHPLEGAGGHLGRYKNTWQQQHPDEPSELLAVAEKSGHLVPPSRRV